MTDQTLLAPPTRFAVAIDDVGPLMASLPKELQGSGKGICFIDGDLVVADKAASATVARAIAKLPAARKAALIGYAATVRYTKEIAGCAVDGVVYPSDRETQAKLTATAMLAQIERRMQRLL